LSAPVVVATLDRDLSLADLRLPLALGDLVAGEAPWEVELGVGKGRFLLARAAAAPERRFLGVEVASEYFQLVRRRARRRGLGNLVAVRGEALFLLAAVLPVAFAEVVHVYFPDPWPKSRHQKRRLFDPQSVDLVVGLLRPGGRLCFATDHLPYGEEVARLLAGYPGLRLTRRDAWPEGARTHYEAKYVAAGRPIVRLEAERAAAAAPLHPEGERAVLVAARRSSG
jgi:tRNA (guanine-N7-)-methyltransferase